MFRKAFTLIAVVALSITVLMPGRAMAACDNPFYCPHERVITGTLKAAMPPFIWWDVLLYGDPFDLYPTPAVAHDCETHSRFNGLAYTWIKVDQVRHGGYAVLSTDADLSAWAEFYSKDCKKIGQLGGPQSDYDTGIYYDDVPHTGEYYEGPVPNGTVFVKIVGWWGTGQYWLHLHW